MKTCLVTGGKGFIGSHLINFLKEKGHFVRCVDIKPTSILETNEDDFLCGDLRKFNVAYTALQGIDWVFNLAANMGGIGYITELNAPIMRDNALINLNMAEAARICDTQRIFFSSSACVYNRNLQNVENCEPLKEPDAVPAYPDSAYGWEKLFSEFMYKSFQHDYGLKVRIARFHNIYGTHCVFRGGQEKAPAALCRKVIEGKDSMVIWGDGKQTRSFLYISDCLEAVYRLMQSNFSEPVNVGANDLISIDDLALLIQDIAGKQLLIKHDLDMPQGVRGRNADIILANKILGWTPTISLKTGMTSLYDWIKLAMTPKLSEK